MSHSTYGQHVIVDIYQSGGSLTLDDLIQAVEAASMTVVQAWTSFQTWVVILAESHLIVHFSHGKCFVDVYTCGPSDPQKAVDVILQALDAKVYSLYRFERGVPFESDSYHQ